MGKHPVAFQCFIVNKKLLATEYGFIMTMDSIGTHCLVMAFNKNELFLNLIFGDLLKKKKKKS